MALNKFKKAHKVKGERESQCTTRWNLLKLNKTGNKKLPVNQSVPSFFYYIILSLKKIVCSVEATELSFLLFLLPNGLVFDRVVAAFVVFHFHSLEKKWFHYWSQCKRVSKVETRSCLKTKRGQKLNGSDLIQALLAEISEKYLWSEFVYQARDFFNRLFLDLHFSLRGNTLRSY